MELDITINSHLRNMVLPKAQYHILCLRIYGMAWLPGQYLFYYMECSSLPQELKQRVLKSFACKLLIDDDAALTANIALLHFKG